MLQYLPTLFAVVSIFAYAATAQPDITLTSIERQTTSGTLTVTDLGPPPLTNCDGVGVFTCPIGTCYTGGDGYIGCCSVSGCAARTTCIPYTSGALQTCNGDTGGCVVCTVAAPACVTVTNIRMNQYIMYCDTTSRLAIYAYVNTITTGSMALPPASKTTLVVPMTSKTNNQQATSSQPTATIPAATSISVQAVTAASGDSGISKGAVAGVSVGSAVGLALIIAAIMIILKRRRYVIQTEDYTRSGPFDPRPDSTEDMSRSNTLPRKLQKAPGPQHPLRFVDPLDAMNATIYGSPILQDRLSRLAEARNTAQAHEIEGSDKTSTAVSPRMERNTDHGWTPPVKSHNVEAYPRSHFQLSNKPIEYIAYNPRISTAAELSSIRHVQPSGTFPSSPAPASAPVSPIPINNIMSPLVGGVSPQTPLMDKWHADCPPSIGQPGATLREPFHWSNTEHLESQPRRNMSVSRSLTNATGGGAKYVTPEMAMAEGFTAGDEMKEEDE